MSKILVTLVEACDKRDFRPVVESVVKGNRRRHEAFEPNESSSVMGSDVNENVAAISDTSALLSPSLELDVYRTILYLANYQCTTAFHAFSALTEAEVVKCFNTTGFENMKNPDYGNVTLDMYMAGDNEAAKAIASQLSKDGQGDAESIKVCRQEEQVAKV